MTRQPARFSARAAAKPPIPPPTTATRVCAEAIRPLRPPDAAKLVGPWSRVPGRRVPVASRPGPGRPRVVFHVEYTDTFGTQTNCVSTSICYVHGPAAGTRQSARPGLLHGIRPGQGGIPAGTGPA
ncbi:hypothetical protein GCM10023220_30680 [Streptomyces ziwulingensis]|uniref:Uncharacterized protein n=1 Tax=Streptomyces ziwulingensis TaxID=1045501 RepID=A0ABP9BVB3_9ACTN